MSRPEKNRGDARVNGSGVIFPRNKVILLASVAKYSQNPRTHSDAQVAQIAASMAEFGWTNPLIVDERDELIAGHGRVMAANTLGLTEAPAIVFVGRSNTRRRFTHAPDP